MSNINSSDSEYSESDEELQEAFAKGLLKPGLNEVVEKKQRVIVNHVSELKKKLSDIKLNYDWIETLTMVNTLAPLAPELALQIREQEEKRENQKKNNAKLPQYSTTDDPILNDFRREFVFHRQAQAAVLEGISKIKALGILTKRPDDYFAEMAKSDDHMQKVRENLLKKQAQAQRSERVKELRAQRKMGKVLQTQARVQKAAEKKEMMDQVKKFRKGHKTDLDFLNNKGKTNQKPGLSKRALEKRKRKDTKFGFGGKKKGSKLNTKDSAADVSEYKRPRKSGIKNGQVMKRPGKNRRKQIKSKGRK